MKMLKYSIMQILLEFLNFRSKAHKMTWTGSTDAYLVACDESIGCKTKYIP